jgi:hypothetical protein
MPVQLKQKRPCEGLRAEHAFFDHSPRCAAIRCSHRDNTVLHEIQARYSFAAIFHADFVVHNDDPLNTSAVSPLRQRLFHRSGSLVIWLPKKKAFALGSNRAAKFAKDKVQRPIEAAFQPPCR